MLRHFNAVRKVATHSGAYPGRPGSRRAATDIVPLLTSSASSGSLLLSAHVEPFVPLTMGGSIREQLKAGIRSLA